MIQKSNVKNRAVRGLVKKGAESKIITGEKFLNENSKVKTVRRVNLFRENQRALNSIVLFIENKRYGTKQVNQH